MEISGSKYHLAQVMCKSEALKGFININPLLVHYHRCNSSSNVTDKSLSNLLMLISRFENCLVQLSKSRVISLKTLELASRKLMGKRSNLRKEEMQLGAITSKTYYKCLAPTQIKGNLLKLITLINSSEYNLDLALYAYFRLIHIHPFLDGNGRLARAIFLTICPKRELLFTPYLHRSYNNLSIYNSLVAMATSYESFKESEELSLLKNLGVEKTNQFIADRRLFAQSIKGELISEPTDMEVYKLLLNRPFLPLDSDKLINFDGSTLSKLIDKGDIRIQKNKQHEHIIYSKAINNFLTQQYIKISMGKKHEK